MHYPVWTYCCKRPNYDFWISQGSVATVLKWGGQNHRFFLMFRAKNYLNRPMFHGVIQKITLAQYFWDTVYKWRLADWTKRQDRAKIGLFYGCENIQESNSCGGVALTSFRQWGGDLPVESATIPPFLHQAIAVRKSRHWQLFCRLIGCRDANLVQSRLPWVPPCIILSLTLICRSRVRDSVFDGGVVREGREGT